MHFKHLCTVIFIFLFSIPGTKSDFKIRSENTKNLTHLEIQPFGVEDYEYSGKEIEEPPIFGIESTGSVDDIHYYLYTKKKSTNPDKLFVDDVDSLTHSSFIRDAPVKMISHGFSGNLEVSLFPMDLNESYLNPQTRDLNVILVDWSILAAGPNYITAVFNVPIVAQQNAKLIRFFVDQKVTTLDKVHLIGHSLGAHVTGDTGYYINKIMGKKVSRATGLDPAKPLFAFTDERGRIDPSDAEFVDIIHTTGLTAGLLRSLGHADFYPNGGVLQNGCSINLDCGHSRAHQYYSESVLNPKGFKACKCDEKRLGFPNCNCNGADSTAYMGEFLSSSARGIYYLETNDKPMFGKG